MLAQRSDEKPVEDLRCLEDDVVPLVTMLMSAIEGAGKLLQFIGYACGGVSFSFLKEACCARNKNCTLSRRYSYADNHRADILVGSSAVNQFRIELLLHRNLERTGVVGVRGDMRRAHSPLWQTALLW